MESFFHTLKTELVHHQHYATRGEARRDIFAYIEGFYNRTRPGRGCATPSPAVRSLPDCVPDTDLRSGGFGR
jgi:transposase InsO family protein